MSHPATQLINDWTGLQNQDGWMSLLPTTAGSDESLINPSREITKWETTENISGFNC